MLESRYFPSADATSSALGACERSGADERRPCCEAIELGLSLACLFFCLTLSVYAAAPLSSVAMRLLALLVVALALAGAVLVDAKSRHHLHKHAHAARIARRTAIAEPHPSIANATLPPHEHWAPIRAALEARNYQRPTLGRPDSGFLGVDVPVWVSESTWSCLVSTGYTFAIVRAGQSNCVIDQNGVQSGTMQQHAGGRGGSTSLSLAHFLFSLSLSRLLALRSFSTVANAVSWPTAAACTVVSSTTCGVLIACAVALRSLFVLCLAVGIEG